MARDPLEPAALATPAISALGVALLVVYGISSGSRAYGMMSDEYYYLACADHLAWGYVDHPPLSIAVLALVKSVLGTSLLAMRLVPALLACLNVALTALLAREMGGGRTAQSLAALATATAPVYLALLGFYSMNAFEPPLWTGAALLLAHIANLEERGGGAAPLWLGLGVLLGLGLLTKLSTSWLCLGLAVGLLATRQRRWLASPWPYACALVALLLFAPHLLWQQQNGWPTLEFMHNARENKMIARSPLDLLVEMLAINWSGSVLLWLPGLAALLLGAKLRRHRWLAWIWLAVFALLVASGTSRANYGAPAFTSLFAAGGVVLEGFARSHLRRAAIALGVVWMFAVGLVSAPFAVPLLSPPELVRYGQTLGIQPPQDEKEGSGPSFSSCGGQTLGIQPPQDEKEGSGPLPLHLALRFGWSELAEAVKRAADTLSPGERLGAVVMTPSYAEAASLNASPLDLPRAISGHNNYWLWGPGDADGEVVIVVTEDPESVKRWYRDVRVVARVECRYCRPVLDRYRIVVARGLRVDRDELWQAVKHYN